MAKKSRAQQDAERLQELEGAQQRMDAGEEVNLDESGNPTDAAMEEAYREIEARMAEQENEPDHHEPVRNEEGIEDLRRQMAEMRRTISNYEQEINPVNRRAQQLEREVEELRTQLASRPQEPEQPTDYGLTEEEQEFETVTSIAEKVSKANATKMLREIENLKAKLEEFEGLHSQNKLDAEIARHRTEVSKALGGDNPDDLFSHPGITKWTEGLAEEEALALHNPLAYSPRFIAGLLSRFKADVVKGQVKREPSHGESSVPSRVSPDVASRSTASQGEVRFDPRTFQKDVQMLISNGKTVEAEKLIKAAERAMSA